MRKLLTAGFFAIVAYFSFVGVALAGNAVPEDGSLLDLARPVYEAIMGGQWWLAAMFGLIFATTAAKRYAPGKLKGYINGDIGQPVTVLVLSFAGAASTALLAAGPGAVLTMGLAWAALKIAVAATGGYQMLKQLLAPLIQKLAAKAPSWMQPIFSVLLWVFSKPSAIAKAEKAGDDAVAANPPTGTPVPGEPKEF